MIPNKFIIIVLFLIMLELLGLISSVNKELFPLPHTIFVDIFENGKYYFKETTCTIKTIFFGLVPAVLFGYTMSFVCYHSKIANYILRPFIDVSQLIPKTALIPIFVAIPFLGFNIKSKILITFLICFFPVFIEVFNGLKLMNINFKRLFESISSTKFQRVLRLDDPAPYYSDNNYES